MKRIILIIILFSLFNGISQNLSKKNLYKLNELNIQTERLDLKNISIQNDLNKILNLDRKRKTNKTIAIILTSVSTASLIFGGAIINKSDHPITDVFGGGMIAGGLIYGGISIPFWVSAKKRKKERNKLIRIFEK